MDPQNDPDQLQAYLDGKLSDDDAASLEARLKTEPALAEALLLLAREEVILTEWARVAAKTNQIEVGSVTARPSLAFLRRYGRPASAAALVLIALGAVYWWRSHGTAENAPLARLERATGEVYIISADARLVAQSGQSLFSGQGLQVVGEDSSAVVAYADGTRLELDADGTIGEFSGGRTTGKRVVLAAGGLRADVAKQPRGLPMILTTPSAEVLVLGTKFGLSSGVDATHVETEEGNVRLTRTSDGRSVEVPAGFEGIAGGATALGAQASPPRFHLPRFTTAGYYLTTALTPDGRTLVTSRFAGGNVTLWNAVTGRERVTLAAHSQQVATTALSLDGRTLATGSIDRSVKLWDVDTGRLLTTLDGPALLQTITFSDDGETLLALAGPPQQEKTLTSWNLSTHAERTDPQKYRGEAWVFSPQGRTLATASAKHSSVTLWDTATGRERVAFREFSARVLSMAISPDESLLAVADKSGGVTVWNIAAARLQFTLSPPGQTVQGLAFSPDGTRLATGQRHATVRLWDVATGKQQAILEAPTKPGSTATVRPMIFSLDGKTLATTESLDDGTVRLWDLPAK